MPNKIFEQETNYYSKLVALQHAGNQHNIIFVKTNVKEIITIVKNSILAECYRRCFLRPG